MELTHLAAERFACPRCQREVDERLYGPCSACRDELGTTMCREAEDSAGPVAFVPKMNVTPNQVATKE